MRPPVRADAGVFLVATGNACQSAARLDIVCVKLDGGKNNYSAEHRDAAQSCIGKIFVERK